MSGDVKWPVPYGWRLVPIQATGDMLDAAERCDSYCEGCHGTTINPDTAWDEMLAAAPEPPPYDAAALREAEARGMERAAEIADRYAAQNYERERREAGKAARLKRAGDLFGHGEQAASFAMELAAAGSEAESIAAAIRRAAQEGKSDA